MSKKKIVKLAVLRSNNEDDSPCPFGLSIPFACKNAGELIKNMAPNNSEELDDEETADLARANAHLLMFNNPKTQCIYVGALFKEKGIVECNWDSNAAGSSPQKGSIVGSPFYYKHFNGIGLDGLYSYPLGYYTDNSIDRGAYYGMYSLENIGESHDEIIKEADDDE